MATPSAAQAQIQAQRRQLQEQEANIKNQGFKAPVYGQSNLRSSNIQAIATRQSQTNQARQQFEQQKSQALAQFPSIYNSLNATEQQIQSQQQAQEAASNKAALINSFIRKLAGYSSFSDSVFKGSNLSRSEREFVKSSVDNIRTAKNTTENILLSQPQSPEQPSSSFGVTYLPPSFQLPDRYPSTPGGNNSGNVTANITPANNSNYVPAPTPTSNSPLTFLGGYNPATTPLPYETRGTISTIPTQQFTPKYTPYKFNPFVVGVKASNALIGNVGLGTQYLFNKGFSEAFPNYQGVRINEPQQTIYTPAMGKKLVKGLLKTGKIPYDSQVIPAKNYMAFTPEQITKSASTIAQGGTGGLIYSTPFVGTGLAVGGVQEGLSNYNKPLPVEGDLKIIPGNKPANVDQGDWDKYLVDVQKYNTQVTAYVDAAKAAKTAGLIEAATSGLFLGLKGYQTYKTLTNPYNIFEPAPEPQSRFKASIFGRGASAEAKMNIITITPAREGVRTNLAKDLLFFGSGENIDLSRPIEIPATARLTTGEFFISGNNALGATAGRPLGKFKTSITQIPSGIAEGPNFDYYSKFLEGRNTNVFKPMQIIGQRSPELTSFADLSPTEQKIIGEISGSSDNLSVTPEMPSDKYQFFSSNVRELKGFPKYSSELSPRITKATTSGIKEIVQPFRPYTFEEIGKSFQVSRAEPLYSVTDAGLTTDFYNMNVGSMKVSASSMSPYGDVTLIPGELSITQLPTGGGSEFNIGPSSVSTITKEASKGLPQTIQSTGEVASTIVKNIPKPRLPSVATKATEIIGTSSAITGSVIGLGQKPQAPLGQTQRPKLETSQQPKQEQPQPQAPRAGQSSGTATSQFFGQPQIEIPAVTPGLGQLPKQQEQPNQQQVPRLAQPQRQRQPNAFGFDFGNPPNTPALLTPPSFVFSPLVDNYIRNRKKSKRIILGEFIPEVRRRGKFKPVSPATSYDSALTRAASVAENSLAASFRIRNSAGQVVSPRNFNSPFFSPSKAKGNAGFGILTQKRGRRLSSFGERKEIQQSRKNRRKNRSPFFK